MVGGSSTNLPLTADRERQRVLEPGRKQHRNEHVIEWIACEHLHRPRSLRPSAPLAVLIFCGRPRRFRAGRSQQPAPRGHAAAHRRRRPPAPPSRWRPRAAGGRRPPRPRRPAIPATPAPRPGAGHASRAGQLSGRAADGRSRPPIIEVGVQRLPASAYPGAPDPRPQVRVALADVSRPAVAVHARRSRTASASSSASRAGAGSTPPTRSSRPLAGRQPAPRRRTGSGTGSSRPACCCGVTPDLRARHGALHPGTGRAGRHRRSDDQRARRRRRRHRRSLAARRQVEPVGPPVRPLRGLGGVSPRHGAGLQHLRAPARSARAIPPNRLLRPDRQPVSPRRARPATSPCTTTRCRILRFELLGMAGASANGPVYADTSRRDPRSRVGQAQGRAPSTRSSSRSTRRSDQTDVTSKGVGGAVQFVFVPHVEFGLNAAQGTVWSIDSDGQPGARRELHAHEPRRVRERLERQPAAPAALRRGLADDVDRGSERHHARTRWTSTGCTRGSSPPQYVLYNVVLHQAGRRLLARPLEHRRQRSPHRVRQRDVQRPAAVLVLLLDDAETKREEQCAKQARSSVWWVCTLVALAGAARAQDATPVARRRPPSPRPQKKTAARCCRFCRCRWVSSTPCTAACGSTVGRRVRAGRLALGGLPRSSGD